MPAHQRLETDDGAVDARLRLIVQDEFALLDRRAQLMLKRAPVSQAFVHMRFEEADRAASIGLGAIERRIGVGEQGRRVLAVGRIDRDADAHSDVGTWLSPLSNSAASAPQEPLGERFGGRRLSAVDGDQRELVAAEPREERAAGGLAQPPRDLAQQRVAGRVAEHVVDLLEPVEVDAEHRERLVGAVCPFERCGELFVEGGAVGQVGQRVVARHVGDLVARALAVGDVLGEAQHILRFVVLTAHQHFFGGEQAGLPLRRSDRILLDSAIISHVVDDFAVESRRTCSATSALVDLVGGLANQSLGACRRPFGRADLTRT